MTAQRKIDRSENKHSTRDLLLDEEKRDYLVNTAISHNIMTVITLWNQQRRRAGGAQALSKNTDGVERGD